MQLLKKRYMKRHIFGVFSKMEAQISDSARSIACHHLMFLEVELAFCAYVQPYVAAFHSPNTEKVPEFPSQDK